MPNPVLAPIILGHNAFFGVDHLSRERGSEKATFFSDSRRIVSMIEVAAHRGAGGVMLSTHERAAPVTDLIRREKSLAQDLRLYPLLPYVQKYVARANEVGLANVVMESLSGSSLAEKFTTLWKGGKGFLTKDLSGIIHAMIRLELMPFRGLNTPAIFLHDALTDLALGLGLILLLIALGINIAAQVFRLPVQRRHPDVL